MKDSDARDILKRHAALYGDKQYEPARWVLDAIHEAARVGADEYRIQEQVQADGPQPWPGGVA